MKRFNRIQNKKSILGLVILGLLFLGLAGGVILSLTNQDIRNRAQGTPGTVDLIFDPSEGNKSPGNVFDVYLKAKPPAAVSVSGAEASFTAANQFTINSVTCLSPFNSLVYTNITGQSATVRCTVGIPFAYSIDPLVGTNFARVSLTVNTAAALGSAQLVFDNTNTRITKVSVSAQDISKAGTNAAFTIVALTPTRTPTPIAAVYSAPTPIEIQTCPVAPYPGQVMPTFTQQQCTEKLRIFGTVKLNGNSLGCHVDPTRHDLNDPLSLYPNNTYFLPDVVYNKLAISYSNNAPIEFYCQNGVPMYFRTMRAADQGGAGKRAVNVELVYWNALNILRGYTGTKTVSWTCQVIDRLTNTEVPGYCLAPSSNTVPFPTGHIDTQGFGVAWDPSVILRGDLYDLSYVPNAPIYPFGVDVIINFNIHTSGAYVVIPPTATPTLVLPSPIPTRTPTPTPCVPPSPPTGLLPNISFTQGAYNQISWNSVPGAVGGYYVRLYHQSNTVQDIYLDRYMGTSVSFHNFQAGQTYSFWVHSIGSTPACYSSATSTTFTINPYCAPLGAGCRGEGYDPGCCSTICSAGQCDTYTPPPECDWGQTNPHYLQSKGCTAESGCGTSDPSCLDSMGN